MSPIRNLRRRRVPKSRDRLLTAAVLASLAVSAPAQLQLEELGQRMPPGPTGLSCAMGDVDGDGDLDLVCGRSVQTGQDCLYLNDGRGNFVDVTATQMPSGGGNTFSRGMALADVDGDGDLDLILAFIGHNRLYLNDGAGTFADVTSSRMPSTWNVSVDVAVGDIDGDGDLDLAFGSYGYGYGLPNSLYINDGSGSFTDATAAQLPTDSDFTFGLAFGDVDGDGDLDLITANSDRFYSYGWTGMQNRLYLNDGTGTFVDGTASRIPTATDHTTALALADLDGDGDLDVVFGNGLGQQDQLYRNDGSGHFVDDTTASMPLAGTSPSALVAADVDGDGALDLIGAPGMFYRNDGLGHFVDETTLRLSSGILFGALALGDVDADGDLDLTVTGDSSASQRLYLNLQRQLDAPTAPQIGQPYSLDAYMRYGTSSVANFSLAYLSTAPSSITSPFGTIGLDLAAAVPFPATIVPQPAGVGSVGFTVPNAPSLVGQPIYCQSVLVAYPFDLRLSNVVADVIQ
tara:strand:+ start:13248 stop:14795 length:1548 start_codon:yes stop_codon:yes gene_type:complete